LKIPYLLSALLSAVLLAAQAQTAADPASARSATPPGPSLIKDKYQLVEVDRFVLKQGLEFPAEYLQRVREEVANQLVKEKLFARVVQPGETLGADQGPVIRLAGMIHNYKEGSRAHRYLGGQFGAGNAEIDARISLLDATTAQPLVVQEVRGVLMGGVFGGKDEDVTKALAAQIVAYTKLMLRRRIPPPLSLDSGKTASPASSAPERHSLTISAKNPDDVQQKLDQEAAAGFCVVDFSLSGSSTADLELEKLAAPPETYQYRWLHMRMATHLEKSLNESAADGFHAFPHSLAWLGPYLSVLMEKPPVRDDASPRYKVTHPLRVSSAEKDIETHELEGYLLRDETEAAPLRILLFEKLGGQETPQGKN
jgi:hypothetical protein